MPRGIDMRHDMDGPASRERLVGSPAGILRQRIETAANAGIGAEQGDRAEQPLGFVDEVEDVVLLPDIAFERGAIDRGRDDPRGRAIDIGDDNLRRAGAMKGFAQRPADAVGAAGDNHGLAAHLHRQILFV